MIDRALLAEIKQTPRLFFLSLGMAFISAVLLLWAYWLVATIISHAFLSGSDLPALRSLFMQAIGVFTLRAVVDYAGDLCSRKLASTIQRELRVRIIHHVAQLGPQAMKKKQSGSMLTLLLEGVETLDAYFRGYLPQLVKALFIPILFLAVVLPMDRIAALIFFFTLPLIPFFMILIGQWTRQASQRQWRLISQLSGYLQDVLRGLETLVVLGRSKEQGEKIADISESYRVSTLRVQRWAFISSLALELVATISIALVAVSLGLRLVSGEMTYHIALFILLLAPEYYQPMRNLGSYFHAGLDAEAAAHDIFAFLQRGAETAALGEPVGTFESLVFENVSYRYPEETQDAVQDVSFTVHADDFVALVGQSGSGKSTLMLLALGFIKPTKGRILINGRDLHNNTALSDWQQHIAYVSQQPYLFQGTLWENIAMADQLDRVQKDRIKELATETGLLASLPSGVCDLEAVVGQGGMALSGGQQELLFLTRALYENRPVLFLDEITDNLDVANEQHVVCTLQNLLRQKTALVIAHRLSTVAQADRILVFQNGKIVEEGSPDELAAQAGAYRRLLEGGRS